MQQQRETTKMKIIDVNEIFKNTNIDKIIEKSFAKHLNKSEEETAQIFAELFKDKINKIGETMFQNKDSNPDLSRLRDLSSADFFKDNDKIIKDE